MSENDFIEVYANALDAKTCATLIRRFDASGQAVRGATGGGVDTRLKDSWDISISDRADWKDVATQLNATMLGGLMTYLRRYPYLALAPMTLRMPDPASGELSLLDPRAVAALSDDRLRALVTKCFRPGTINLQKYIADQGGYPYWHCETYPKADGGETLHRVLLWSIYLNEDFSEGETEFFHQRRAIAPRTGALLFAPAGFTHTHRGNRPSGCDKYIATSWVLFQRAEQVYAPPGGAPKKHA
jgi:hypothetical protein